MTDNDPAGESIWGPPQVVEPSVQVAAPSHSRADALLSGAEHSSDATVAASCDKLGKVYRTEDEQVQALSEVSKDFLRGGLTAIVGPSGSGKSSLLRILACLDRPTTGSSRIDGVDVSRLSVRGRRKLRRTSVAYMFQNPIENLIEYLPALAQLDLNARLRRRPASRAECIELLERLGMGHRLDHYPVQLSGGEQQRLAVGCAVIGHPAIVVADEPTAELDSHSADLVLAAFGSLSDLGVAFLLSSHDPKVIERCDHLLRLDHGEVTESW